MLGSWEESTIPGKELTGGPYFDRGGRRLTSRAVPEKGRGGLRGRSRKVRARKGEGALGETAGEVRERPAGKKSTGPFRSRSGRRSHRLRGAGREEGRRGSFAPRRARPSARRDQT